MPVFYSRAGSRSVKFTRRAEIGYNMVSRGWVFSSSRRVALASIGPTVVHTASCALFSLIFPSDCRICGERLHTVTRLPVCPDCLKRPQPLSTAFFCVRCRTPFQNAFPLDDEGLCGLCRHGLRGFDAAYCFGAYEGKLRDLIHLYKYGKVQTLARPLGDFMATALPRDERFDAIVPVPLHWRRQWQRGFNQSERLALTLSRRTAIPVSEALRRVHSTAMQAGLSNTARRLNVSTAFSCRCADAVAGKRILLIDDVMTTGSTASACAAELKNAGAARVVLLTVARVDRRLDVSNLQPETFYPEHVYAEGAS
jgi:ComF family protein